MGITAEPLHEGKAGRLMRAARRLTVAGALGSVFAGRSRALAVASGAALLAGSACTRFGIFEAGQASGPRPQVHRGPAARAPRPAGRPATAPRSPEAGSGAGGRAPRERRPAGSPRPRENGGVSNLEDRPDEFACATAPAAGVEILTLRDVPLGGPRAMRVRRTLPQRQRSLIGAWCFVDHYGPEGVRRTGPGWACPPSPHRAADGELAVGRARSSIATASAVTRGPPRRAQPDDPRARHRALGGLGRPNRRCTAPQLWVALPNADRPVDPAFEHLVPSR